jgi:hypothetical protein
LAKTPDTGLQLHRVFDYLRPGHLGAWGVMFWRGGGLWLAAVLLSGCVTERTGFDYAAVTQKIGAPRAGQSRIVVLQEKGNSLGATVCEVTIDGSPAGKLTNGTYVYADRPAGRHQLLATEALFPGQSRREITTESARIHFFLARPSERHNAVTGMGLVGGLAGIAVASVVTSGSESSGPIDFFPLDEAAARAAITGLQLAQ